MDLNQRQIQLGDFLQQLLETMMFFDPLGYLILEIVGDVDRLGFPALFEGQIPAQMPLAGGAVAAGITAASGDADQTGG